MRRLKALVIPLALLFMTAAVWHQWHEIPRLDWAFRPAWLVLATLGLVLLFFLDAVGWHLILRTLDVRPHLADSVRVWMFSSVTRYLPGGIWPYLSRTSMAGEIGVDAPKAAVSLYLETLLLAAAALVIGLPAILGLSTLPVTPLAAGATLALLVLLMTSPVRHLLGRLPGSVGARFASLPWPASGELPGLLFFYLGIWVLFGATFAAFVQAFHPLTIGSALQAGSGYALAFAAGLVVIIAPGGIGVREAILYLTLAPIMEPPAATLIAVGSRLWVMTGEAISLLAVAALHHLRRRRVRIRRLPVAPEAPPGT